MQRDPVLTILVIGLYIFIASLFLYQIEIRWRCFSRIKCKFGKHKRGLKCPICGKPKQHNLTLIKGEKKDFEVTFKF